MRALREQFIAKAVALLILTACVIGIPCFGYFIWQSREVVQISDFWGYSYPESSEFSADVNLRLTQLIDYLRLKEMLETNGELDYNKVVANVYDLDGIEEYTVNDLIKYNVRNYGFYPEEAILDSLSDAKEARIVLDSLRRAVYPIMLSEDEKTEAGGVIYQEKFVTDFIKEEKVFTDLDEACRYYQALWNQTIQESISADGNSADRNRTEIEEFLGSISDKLEKENTINGAELLIWADSSEAVQVSLLPDVAYCMTFYVALYQEYKNIFERDVFSEQDLLYWISDGNRRIETNMQKNLPEEDDFGRRKYKYPSMGEIWYQTENHLMEATMAADRKKIAELEELFLERGKNRNISIFLVIPADHTGLFEQQMKLLEHSYHSVPKYMGFMIAFGILAVVSICFLFYSAGHRAGYEGIFLNWFDRWYTEIAAGICIGLGIFLLVLFWEETARVLHYQDYDIVDGIVAGLSGFGLYIMVLISFSSLAKRIKAGSLWRNSLTCRILGYIKRKIEKITASVMQMWENRSISKKIIFFYIGMLIGNFILPVAVLFFCEAVDYGELVVAVLCFCIIVLVLLADFKTLKWLMQQKAELLEIYKGMKWISSKEWNYKLEETAFHGILQDMAAAVNQIGDGLSSAIEQSIRDERMKTDLITNVSHDIKTPLTSIINYVDLLKREQFEDEKVKSYLEVLDQKSQRLKQLIDDLIEASKLSSETVDLLIEKIDLVELVRQTNGEFAEKFTNKNLSIVPSLPEKSVVIEADGKGMWRVLENLYINVSKYAMEHTRVYISISEKMGMVEFSIKNISDSPLNIEASELTERFIRGDLSRSTEGSGLGLSIAKSLTELMHGKFEIYLDGDLFRVTLVFPVCSQEKTSFE